MDAVITGENDELIGLSIVDNADAEHIIDIRKADGDITGHQCDSYADHPSDRTPDENEHNNQARRFAKYYVYQERGYDTVDNAANPDYINAVRTAIADLSAAEFERFFGPLHQQIRSHHDDSIQRVVEHPTGVRAEDSVVYEPNVYLGVDLEDETLEETAQAVADTHGLDFEAATESTVTEVSTEELVDWKEAGQQVIEQTEPETIPVIIAAVSGIHIGYPDSSGEHTVHRAREPLDRQPDTTIELLPADPGTIFEFREYLDHHLRCQIRDCFAGMGLLPPEPFQTVGFGKFICARRYDHYDLYPKFHKPETDSKKLFGIL